MEKLSLFLLLLTLANTMHMYYQLPQQKTPWMPTVPFVQGQSYSNICIAGFNGEYGDRNWGYLSIHDNHELYHAGACLGN